MVRVIQRSTQEDARSAERIEARRLQALIESEAEGQRAGRQQAAAQVRQQRLRRGQPPGEQAMHVPAPRDAGARQRVGLQRIALQDQNMAEVPPARRHRRR